MNKLGIDIRHELEKSRTFLGRDYGTYPFLLRQCPSIEMSLADGHQGVDYHLRTKSVCNTFSSISLAPGTVLIGLVL